MSYLSDTRVLILLGMGALSSLLFTFALSGSFLGIYLSVFCQAPLYYVFLTQGPRATKGALLMGLFSLALLRGLPLAFVYAFLLGLPLLLTCRFLDMKVTKKNGAFLSQGFMALFYYGALMMTLLFGLVEVAVSSGIVDALTPLLNTPTIKAYLGRLDKGQLTYLIRISPGITLYWSLVVTIVSATLTQAAFLNKIKKTTQKTLNLDQLELPKSLWILFVTCAFCGFFLDSSFIGVYAVNVMLVLAVLFLVQGLSVLHAFCRNPPRKLGVLWTFYALVVMFQHVAFVMALVGLVEPWTQLRRRIYEKTRR